jgi:hypothetical protein
VGILILGVFPQSGVELIIRCTLCYMHALCLLASRAGAVVIALLKGVGLCYMHACLRHVQGQWLLLC